MLHLILGCRIRDCLVQLYAKDITPDDKQELDEALQREVKFTIPITVLCFFSFSFSNPNPNFSNVCESANCYFCFLVVLVQNYIIVSGGVESETALRWIGMLDKSVNIMFFFSDFFKHLSLVNTKDKSR